MTLPALMVVDDDPESLAVLTGTLRRRYGEDYRILSDASPAAALGRLRELWAAGDVRHGSVKRVASAVGEGSIATTQISQYLQNQTGNP